MQNRQTNIFQRANTIENQLSIISQRIHDIKRMIIKLMDSHINIEQKLKQIKDSISTVNIDEKQERLIRTQVSNMSIID